MDLFTFLAALKRTLSSGGDFNTSFVVFTSWTLNSNFYNPLKSCSTIIITKSLDISVKTLALGEYQRQQRQIHKFHKLRISRNCEIFSTFKIVIKFRSWSNLSRVKRNEPKTYTMDLQAAVNTPFVRLRVSWYFSPTINIAFRSSGCNIITVQPLLVISWFCNDLILLQSSKSTQIRFPIFNRIWMKRWHWQQMSSW